MNPKRKILLLFLLTPLYIFSQPTNYKPRFKVVFDSVSAPKLLKQCRDVPKNIFGFWTLYDTDITFLEDHFEEIYAVTSENRYSREEKITGLDYYGFQFCGIIVNNQKLIYINAFPFSLLKKTRKFYHVNPYKTGFFGVMVERTFGVPFIIHVTKHLAILYLMEMDDVDNRVVFIFDILVWRNPKTPLPSKIHHSHLSFHIHHNSFSLTPNFIAGI